jgi:hypothetical protein
MIVGSRSYIVHSLVDVAKTGIVKTCEFLGAKLGESQSQIPDMCRIVIHIFGICHLLCSNGHCQLVSYSSRMAQ